MKVTILQVRKERATRYVKLRSFWGNIEDYHERKFRGESNMVQGKCESCQLGCRASPKVGLTFLALEREDSDVQRDWAGVRWARPLKKERKKKQPPHPPCYYY